MAKPRAVSGLGFGDGLVVLVVGGLIVGMVAYLALTKSDVQPDCVSEAEPS